MRPSTGPSSSSQATRRATPPGSGGLLSFLQTNLEIWCRKVAHPRWWWGQIHPLSWPSGQMAGSALIRVLMLSPPYSCPPVNPTFLSKKKKKYNLSLIALHQNKLTVHHVPSILISSGNIHINKVQSLYNKETDIQTNESNTR